MKVCSKCGVSKNEADFGKHRDFYKGVVKYYEKSCCIACDRKYQREWNKNRKSLMPAKPAKPIETERKCKRCGEVKSVEMFGNLRGRKNVKKTCKKCLCDKSKAHYHAIKEDSGFKEMNRKKSNQYYHSNKEYCGARNKKYQSTEEYKARRRAGWENKYQKNRSQILSACKRYNKKKISSLSDQYILTQLEKEGVERSVVRQHPELIEAKRITLKIKRQISNYAS